MKHPQLLHTRHLTLLLLTALAVTTGCQRTELTLTPETPIFAQPDHTSQILAVTQQDLTVQLGDHYRDYKKVRDQWHPMMVACDFYRIDLGPDQQGWVSEDLLYDQQTGRIIPRIVPKVSHQYRFLLLLALLLIGLYVAWRTGTLTQLLTTSGLAPWRTVAAALLLILGLRYTLLAGLLYFSGNAMPLPLDETSYFAAGRWLLGHGGGPFYQTAGQGFIYIPFILLTGAQSYNDILPHLTILNAWILTPAALLLGFLILQRLGGSTRAALAATLLMAVLPFIYTQYEFHADGVLADQAFKALVGLPDFNIASYQLYYVQYFAGYSGMSDPTSMFLILGLIWLALWWKPGWPYLIIISFLFGFACIIRMNNIFFGPLFAYLYWLKFRHIYRSPAQVAGYILAAIAICLLGILPQFIINHIHQGGMLIPPYIHQNNRAAEGFNLSQLPNGIHYLLGINYLFMVTGVLGLAFLRQRRRLVILTLWAIPLVLFFPGFVYVGGHPNRWLLTAYPALLGALALAPFWRQLDRRTFAVATGIVLLHFLLVSPADRTTAPFPLGLSSAGAALGLEIAIGLLSLLAMALWLRHQRQALLALGAFLILYHLGAPYVLYPLFLVLGARAIYHAVRDVIDFFRPPLAQDDTSPSPT